MKPQLWSLNFINVCIANFLMACSFNLLMPSIPLYITEHLGVAQSQTGIVLASYAIALIFVRPFSGFLVDRFPRKRMLLIGLIGYVLVFFGYFWASTVLLFVLVRFMHGLTWGLSTVSSSTLTIDVVPSERRAEGVGFYATAMNVAMAIGPFIAIHIYHNYSFQVLLWCAIAMGILGILAAALITAPEQALQKDKEPFTLDRFFLVKGWPIFLNQMLPTFAWGTIGPFVAQYGLSIQVANPGIFFLFWAGGIILSRVFAGKLVDRGHVHRVAVGALILITCAFYVFATVHNIYAFCISGVFIGIGFGALFPSFQILYINLVPNNKRGTANSTYFLAFDLGLAFGMLAGGYISGYFSFETLYIVASAFCLISIAVYVLNSRRVYEKNRLDK